MNLLLDTHIFLWFIAADSHLPVGWRDRIIDPANTVFLSVAAVWEAVIKYECGKLPLPEQRVTYLPRWREQHKVASLAIDEATVKFLARLPSIHKDPFDRILIAQALQHDLTLMTVDADVRAYPVKLLDP
jgi:PIN domain nuclease of toxin-antitoxin system